MPEKQVEELMEEEAVKEVVKEEKVEEELVEKELVEEEKVKEEVVQEESIEEEAGESKLGQSWPPLTQAMTSKSLEKTRLSALSVSHDKRLEMVIEEQEMQQEITSVSLYMCTII